MANGNYANKKHSPTMQTAKFRVESSTFQTGVYDN
jgi:hypothetical protein